VFGGVHGLPVVSVVNRGTQRALRVRVWPCPATEVDENPQAQGTVAKAAVLARKRHADFAASPVRWGPQ